MTIIGYVMRTINKYIHILVSEFHSRGRLSHRVQYLSVSVGALQCLSLHLYLAERAVNLCELLLVTLLAFKCSDGRWKTKR